MAAVTPNVTYLSDGSCEVSAEGAGLGQFMTPQECAAAAASNEACYAAKLGSTSTFVWSAEGECSCCESPPFLGTYISAVYAMEWDNGNPTPTTPDSPMRQDYFPGNGCLVNESASLPAGETSALPTARHVRPPRRPRRALAATAFHPHSRPTHLHGLRDIVVSQGKALSTGDVCCNISQWWNDRSSASDLTEAPVEEGLVWVTADDWDAFINNTSPNWGNLKIEVTEAQLPQRLTAFDELFVRGTYTRDRYLSPLTRLLHDYH